MWSRELIKKRAKEVLKTSYWKAFLVSLIIGIIGGGRNSGVNLNFLLNENKSSSSYTNYGTYQDLGSLGIIFVIAAIIIGIIMLLAIAFRVFVGYPLEVGGRRYFIKSAQSDVDMNNLGYGFGQGRYMGIVKTMFWKGFINFLWYLLLIIPGIIKYYSYSMVPYILADNPNIGRKRAIELSRRMTHGEKFNIWVLELSFIGWYLLGMLAFFIGMVFVLPYENTTKAELYLILRQNVIDEGFCTEEELLINTSEI